MKKPAKPEKSDVHGSTFGSHFRDESICSHHESDNRITIDFNLHNEVIQRYIMKQFSGRLMELGMKEENIKDTLRNSSHNLDSSDFDGTFLKPQQFIKFCSYIYINPKKLYDSYYSYVFSDYGSTFIKFREEHNLTQKQLASIIRVSPVDLGLFEKGIKYPTRCQFSKISRVLMKPKDT